MTYEEALEAVRALTPEQQTELDALIRQAGVVWAPLPGPQTMAYESRADVIGYGGAAGGGKTDLAIGLALTRHRKSAVFRREATQLTGILDRMSEIMGNRDGYSSRDGIWRIQGNPYRQVEFGSTPHLGDETRFQGRPKDLLVLDETANFLEHQARFLMGWVRTTISNQRCSTLMTFNPPTDADGLWIIKYFAPWIDDTHPKPAQPGELRWFAMVNGKELEVEERKPFTLDGELLIPQSRTFIPSRIADNPFLMGTGYMAQLQALPEPLRSQMLRGDFKAGLGDSPWQVIPTSWIKAAQDRWQPRDRTGAMDSMGVDVARGGRDQLVISRRHGTWFAELSETPGSEVPDGPTGAGKALALRRDACPVHVDVIGWGSSVHDFLTSNGVQSVAVNGSSKSLAITDDASRLRFANLRAEVWWRMREALDPSSDNGIALPPSTELRADLAAPRWKLAAQGIQIEGKEDLIKRLGRSPDRGDAVCMAMIQTPKWEDDPRYRAANAGRAISDYDPYA